MKVLVTGANGQLGMSLCSVLQNPVLQNPVLLNPVILSEAKNLYFVFTDVNELDITDLDAVRKMVKEEGIDAIVNCAGYTNVEGAEDQPELAELLNAKAVENLAVAMKETGGLLLHISTDYVFGGEVLTSPIKEEQKPAPQGVYAVTKLHGEEAIQRVDCRHIIIRTAWLYSEYGRNFVKTMLRLTAEKPSLKVVDDQRGTPTYAKDLAKVIVRILSKGLAAEENYFSGRYPKNQFSPAIAMPAREVDYSIFHYTNEGECTWYEFACAIAELSGHTGCEIRPCTSAEFPSKVHRPAYSVLDKGKIQSALGITIPHWRASLQVCLKGMSL